MKSQEGSPAKRERTTTRPAPSDEAMRRIPAVPALLEHPSLAASLAAPGRRGLVLEAIRAELADMRARLAKARGSGEMVSVELDAVASRVVGRLARDARPLPRVINATGVILHSGLGRAPLGPAAAEAVKDAAAPGSYSLLEVDRAGANRRARDTRCVELLKVLTGAEDGLVVNNNAAATVLILHTLARGREVICSRGEMVEIGGSFRIPDVMEASGCRLVSVGTTNKTHLEDYERAIGPDTAALLVVHTSNYRIVGFTEHPPLDAIVRLGRERGVPVIHDLGSGSLLSPEQLGCGDEPPVSKSLEAGADVVCLSGDKMLGGPQAGIILGRREIVARCRSAPLARAFRIDKLRIAALEATLPLFLDPRTLDATHPVTAMLRASPDALRPRAERLRSELAARAPAGTSVEIVPTRSEAGSGALPALEIESLAVAVSSPRHTPDELSRALREEPTPVFTLIRASRVLLDVRTMTDGDAGEAAAIIAAVLGRS